MPTITIEVSDQLSEMIARAGDRLPELLERSLQQPALPAHVYRYVLDFLAGRPSPQEITTFGPTPEMTERLRTLVRRQTAGEITAAEMAEIDEYERLEHLMVMIKSNAFRHLTDTR